MTITDFERLKKIAKSTHAISDFTQEEKDFLVKFFVEMYQVQLKSSNDFLELVGYTFVEKQFYYVCRKLDCSTILISAKDFELCCTDEPQHYSLYSC